MQLFLVEAHGGPSLAVERGLFAVAPLAEHRRWVLRLQQW